MTQKIISSARTFVRIIIHLEANVAQCIQHHNRGGLKQFSAMLVFMIAMVMRLMLPLMTMTMIMEVSGYLNPDAMVGIVVAFSSQTHLKLALHFHYHQDNNHIIYFIVYNNILKYNTYIMYYIILPCTFIITKMAII